MVRSSWLLILLLSTLTIKSLRAEEDELCDDEPDDPDVCPFDTTGVSTNVALGKTAEQSTKYKSGGEANLAIDGDNRQKFWEAPLTCSHTAEHNVEGETKPWFRVDLGSPHVVTGVKLYSRSDPCCADRYHDLEIRVGNEKEGGLDTRFHRNGLCTFVKGGGFPRGHVFDLTCAPCLAGRYVSVQIVHYCTECKLPNKNILSICELEILGYKV